MPQISAGLLMYRLCEGQLQVLLVHPGGPFFKNKDEGAWSIPKGEPADGEELLDTAIREFHEETGLDSNGPYIELRHVKLKSGKIVHAWAFEGDCSVDKIVSNRFSMEWPPKSGKFAEFPEVDRAGFFDLPTARGKINAGQAPLLDQLQPIVLSR